MAMIEELARELRVDAARVRYLEALNEAERRALREAIQQARTRQKETLKAATEHALGYVPALLRGAVRKILFG